MEAVAKRFLSTVELTDLERNAAIEMCQTFHTSTEILSAEFLSRLNRHNYVTPTSYLEMINTFKTLLARKRNEITTAKNRYETGLMQLDSAAGQVGVMQENLEALQPQLIEAAANVQVIVAKVETSKIPFNDNVINP